MTNDAIFYEGFKSLSQSYRGTEETADVTMWTELKSLEILPKSIKLL